MLADLEKMLPPMIRMYLFTLIIPVILAAFFWMCVGVLDRECTASDKSKSVEFTRNAHIAMGSIATLVAAYTVSKVLFGMHKAGKFKRS